MRQQDECGEIFPSNEIHGRQNSQYLDESRKGGVGKEGGCGDILRNDTEHVRRGARCGGKIMQWRSWPDGWFYGTPSPKHYDYYYSHYHHSHLSYGYSSSSFRRARFSFRIFAFLFRCVDMFTLLFPPRLFFFFLTKTFVVWGTGQAFVLLLCFQLFLWLMGAMYFRLRRLWEVSLGLEFLCGV